MTFEPENLKSLYNKCLEYKENGNKEFLKDSKDDKKERAITYYQLAIKLYNDNFNKLKLLEESKSVDITIELENNLNKLMGIIHSNLSLIYLNQFKIIKSLEMSEQGLKFDNKSNSKCWYRNSLGKRALCQFAESLESLENAIDVESKTNNNLNLKKEFLKEKKDIQLKIEKSIKEEEDFKKRMIRDEAMFKQFPNVNVVWKEGYGRVTLAAKDIEKNEIVFRVAPFASTLEDKLLFDYCGFCLQEIASDKKQDCICKDCKLHSICNSCRSLDGNIAVLHHREICDIFKFLNHHHPNSQSRDFRLMARCFVNIMLGRSGKDTRYPTIFGGKVRNDHPYISDTHNDFVALSRDTKVVDQETLAKFKRGATSMYNLISSVRGYEFFKNLPQNEMLALYSTIMSNAHSFGPPLENLDIGRGIFPSACYYNHSCSPNLSWHLDETGMMVYSTLKPVKKGEELFITYTDNTQSVQVRRELLLNHYSFFCQCELCEFQSNLSGHLCMVEGCNKEPLIQSSIQYHEPLNDEEDAGYSLTCINGHSRRFNKSSPKMTPESFADYDEETMKENAMSRKSSNKFLDKRTFSKLNAIQSSIEYLSEFETLKAFMTPAMLKELDKLPKDFEKQIQNSKLYQKLLDCFDTINTLFEKEDQLNTPIIFGPYTDTLYKLFKAVKTEDPTNIEKLELLKNNIINDIDKNQYNSFKNLINNLLKF